MSKKQASYEVIMAGLSAEQRDVLLALSRIWDSYYKETERERIHE